MTEIVDPYEEPHGTPDLQEPDEEPPLTAEESVAASEKLKEAADAGLLTTGRALAGPEEEEIPPTPDESDPPPPGEYVSMFRIERNRFGAGTWGIDICHSDGEMEPVMVFLARVHPDWSGGEVASWLTSNGLPQEHAVRLGRQRDRADEGAVVVEPVELPADIEEVWGGGKLDGMGLPAITTARTLVAKWGVEGFRNSAIHKAALAEIEHVKLKDDFSRAYVAAQRKKGAYVAPPREKEAK